MRSGVRRGRIKHQDDQVGRRRLCQRPADALGLDAVAAVADSCRIGQLDRPAAQGGGGGEDVAGGAGLVGDDRPLVAEEGVDQAAFADVGRAGDNDPPGTSQVQAQVAAAEERLGALEPISNQTSAGPSTPCAKRIASSTSAGVDAFVAGMPNASASFR